MEHSDFTTDQKDMERTYTRNLGKPAGVGVGGVFMSQNAARSLTQCASFSTLFLWLNYACQRLKLTACY